jgi:hypothetical protein
MERKFTKLIKKSIKILTGELILKPTIMNKIHFYYMKMTIKNNPNYFIYENRVWKERGWINR